ncbi:23252_t:CDS:2 [Dentiscutata erythropus]|uniref:23252_t:CDS:1 n=1 Tax=Dentiscutata erythropus TaxID=1348616 RepID=A0A9N9EHH2_9GLOM|nr:23252_t:CDS:2 [Dentiscutata erythropus]
MSLRNFTDEDLYNERSNSDKKKASSLDKELHLSSNRELYSSLNEPFLDNEALLNNIPLNKESSAQTWIIDNMQPFNVLKNDWFHDLLYEAELQYRFLGEDTFKQKITLLFLYEAIKRLQEDLAKDKEKNIRNNTKILENLLLNEEELTGIQELVDLLGPFVHVTTIIGGDYYPTFSMMLLLIKRLQEHLFRKETTLKHSIIRDVHDKIELSFRNRWDEPERRHNRRPKAPEMILLKAQRIKNDTIEDLGTRDDTIKDQNIRNNIQNTGSNIIED